MTTRRHVVIVGVGSDIGQGVARLFVRDGAEVFGTYHRATSVTGLRDLRHISLHHCDMLDERSISEFARIYSASAHRWDLLICYTGTLEPIGRFVNCDFDDWRASLQVNALGPLKTFQALYPYRTRVSPACVVFFGGAGTNSALPNYSAYCASKILLIKMCELITAEDDDLNVVALGPGFVNTKIHRATLESGARAGDNYSRTVERLKGEGTSLGRIYDCINWVAGKGGKAVRGRNVSIVHDRWSGDEGNGLINSLLTEPDMFKLRRNPGAD